MTTSQFEADIKRALSPVGKGRLLVCVSGGADSTALLLALSKICLKSDIIVAHCNFQLRGEESLRDENFTINLCRSLSVECRNIRFDTQDYCRKHHLSIEEGCRNLRYEWFRKLKKELNLIRIVTAHNADDNIETFFLNLFRGAGSKGLSGMPLDTGEILRPLITFHRKEILQYLEEEGADYVNDSTNFQSDYSRNYIRNIIIPTISEKFPGAPDAILKSQGILHEENNLIDTLAIKLKEDNILIPFSKIEGHLNITPLIHRLLSSSSLPSSMVREIAQSLLRKNVGAKWIIPSSKETLYIERDGLVLYPKDYNESKTLDSNEIEQYFKIEERICDSETMKEVKFTSLKSLWLPINPFSDKIIWRTAQKGDRIHPLGMKGTMLISHIMKDAKLAEGEKRSCIMAVDAERNEIIWIPGLKRSRFYLITDSAKDTPIWLISSRK